MSGRYQPLFKPQAYRAAHAREQVGGVACCQVHAHAGTARCRLSAVSCWRCKHPIHIALGGLLDAQHQGIRVPRIYFTITVATAHTCILHECGVARAPVVLRLPAPKHPQPPGTGPAPESGRSSNGTWGPCPPDDVRLNSAGSLQSGIWCCRPELPNPFESLLGKLPAKAELS